MKHLDSVPVASRLQPGPAHRVTLLRWGAGISLGLVLLACGGPADLQLGRDSDALESSGDRPGSDPTRAAEAPSADTSNASPSLPPGAASGPGYLVDPTTGQVFLPCETPVAADTASAEPSATDQPSANVDPTIPDQPSATDQPAASGESTGAGTPQPCGPVGASPNDRSAEP